MKYYNKFKDGGQSCTLPTGCLQDRIGLARSAFQTSNRMSVRSTSIYLLGVNTQEGNNHTHVTNPLFWLVSKGLVFRQIRMIVYLYLKKSIISGSLSPGIWGTLINNYFVSINESILYQMLSFFSSSLYDVSNIVVVHICFVRQIYSFLHGQHCIKFMLWTALQGELSDVNLG